jgi:hypothetical protein
MATQDNGGPRYRVHASGAVTQEFLRLQQQAEREGRGQEVLSAMRAIARQLHYNAADAGEPLYHLAALSLQVRHIAVRPLGVTYAVHESWPLVFLQVIQLLPTEGS